MKENSAAASAVTRRPGGSKMANSIHAVSLGIYAGAALVLGMITLATAARAQADVDSVFQPVVGATAMADSGFATLFDSSLDGVKPAPADPVVENAAAQLLSGPGNLTAAWRGVPDQCVLLDKTGGRPLASYALVDGSPASELEVYVGGGGASPADAMIDPGGADGTMPESILTNAQLGESFSVDDVSAYTVSGQSLYSFASKAGHGTTVNCDDVMKADQEAFQIYPEDIGHNRDGLSTAGFDYD